MRITKPLLLSAVFAAAMVGALAYYVSSLPSAVPPAPPAPPAQMPPAPAPAPPLPTGSATSTSNIYTNAKFGFTVGYPDSIVPTEDKQDMALSGYIPVCDPDNAVVCFPYAKELMPGKNFDGAALAVHVLPKLKTSEGCLAVGNGEQEDGTATIGGTSFVKYSFGDGAMSHQLAGERYRVFKNATCIELSTSMLTTTFEVYAPGMVERFTDEDRSSVQRVLEDMLMSFRLK